MKKLNNTKNLKNKEVKELLQDRQQSVQLISTAVDAKRVIAKRNIVNASRSVSSATLTSANVSIAKTLYRSWKTDRKMMISYRTSRSSITTSIDLDLCFNKKTYQVTFFQI